MTKEIPVYHVNKNYLEKVMDLSEETEVLAYEDIFDTRGKMLLAKGAKVSRDLQERLILHKLSKPLEASLAVADGIDVNHVISEAKRISETSMPIACLLKVTTNSDGFSPLQMLKGARFNNAMSVLLKLTERGGSKAFSHGIMVSLVAACLASKIGLGEKDQTDAALAGLFHDIGELYIEPEYMHGNRRLLPHEWRHIVVHPRIGQMLLRKLGNFSSAVAQAVAEHHERFDGAGYPRKLAGSDISIIGQVVSVAETLSGVFMKEDRPFERAELALKIIPGEHARELISAISRTTRIANRDNTSAPAQNLAPKEAHQKISDVYDRLVSSISTLSELLDSQSISTDQGRGILLQALNQLHSIRRALSSTGLDVCIEKDSELLDARDLEIMFEAGVAVKEIQWRLCDVARNIALYSPTLASNEADFLEPLISLLDGAH